MLVIMSFLKLERAKDSQILAVKRNNRNKQDQITFHGLKNVH